MSVIESTEQAIAWDLRKAWISGRRVSVRLDPAVCVVERVAGTVTHVAVTGAHADIREEVGEEPWRVFCVDVLAVRFPHFSEPRDRRRRSRRGREERVEVPGQISMLELLEEASSCAI